jgi:hypothetical protein
MYINLVIVKVKRNVGMYGCIHLAEYIAGEKKLHVKISAEQEKTLADNFVNIL